MTAAFVTGISLSVAVLGVPVVWLLRRVPSIPMVTRVEAAEPAEPAGRAEGLVPNER
jgi:hypothetical protein